MQPFTQVKHPVYRRLLNLSKCADNSNDTIAVYDGSLSSHSIKYIVAVHSSTIFVINLLNQLYNIFFFFFHAFTSKQFELAIQEIYRILSV